MSWLKNYTGKDLKVTLKNILLGFDRMDQQNIDGYVLHAKLLIPTKTQMENQNFLNCM